MPAATLVQRLADAIARRLDPGASDRAGATDVPQVAASALDRVSDPHLVCDGRGCCVEMNAAMRALLRPAGPELTRDVWAGRPPWELMPELERAVVERAMAEARDSACAVPFSLVRLAGREGLAGLAYPLPGGTGLVLLEREHRRREEAERARLAAERASKAKGDFLGMMSHELRTPLNAIGGYAELLELGLRGPVTPAQVEDLQKIRRNQRHLSGLISSVLSFVRLDAGRMIYDVTTISVDACLGSMESLVEPQLHVKQVSYTCVPPDPQVTIRADAEKVQQILLNLLDNAIRFTPPGGRIEVRGEVDDARVHVLVSDTGPGVDPARAEEIFEPFVQLASGRERGEGVGLGLAISRELARGMGGEVVLRRTPGSGAIFVLSLPRGADRPAGLEGQSAATP